MSPRGRTAIRAAAVAGVYVVVLVALFWRVWFRGQMSGWDCAVEYWPDLVFQVHSVGSGEWPTWNPYALGGYPYWADPQAGLYAPASWVTWPLAAIGGDGPWLIQVKVLVTLLIALCGMHAWTLRRTRSHVAGFVAALVFVLGSPLLVHKNGALLWPILYVPWALLAVERFVAWPTVRRGAVVAIAVWLVGTAGHPQGTFYGLVVVMLYGAYLIVEAGPRRAHRTLLALGKGGAVAVVLAGALLAATWLPARSAVEASPRAHRGLGYVLSTPLEPGQLDELVVPNLDTNWAADVYVGALPLAGAVWLLVCGDRKRRARAGFWLGVGALGLALALGKKGHLLPWFAEHVPGFDLFRIAYRHKLIFGIAAAALAGEAVGAMLEDARRRAAIAWGALAAAWLGLAVIVAPRWPALALAALVLGGAAAVVVSAGWGEAAPWQRRVRAAARVVLPALVLAELWHAGASKLAILMKRPVPSAQAPKVAAMPGIRDTWRYHVGDMRTPYGGTVPYHVAFLDDVREQSGYINPIEPQRHVEIDKRAKRDPGILRHYNVKYYAGHRTLPPDVRSVYPGIVEAADVAPVARWYGGVELTGGAVMLDRLAATAPSELAVALVERADVRWLALPVVEAGATPAEAPVDGRVVRFERASVTVEVDAPAVGVLVLNEAYAPGWVATVDGRPTRVFRANYHLRAVVVPAGASRIVFRYDPPGRIALPLTFLAGLVASLGLALAPRRRRWTRWLDAGAPQTPDGADDAAPGGRVTPAARVRIRRGTAERSIDVAAGEVTIGRDRGQLIRIAEDDIAPQHAVVHVDGPRSRWEVEARGGDVVLDGKTITPGARVPLPRSGKLEVAGWTILVDEPPPGSEVAPPQRTGSLARDLVRDLLGGEDHGAAPSLAVVGGPAAGQVIPLLPPPSRVVIGRGEGADIVILDSSLSRQHVVFERGVEGVRVRDLDSKNGARVGADPATEAPGRLLRAGDVVVAGGTALRLDDPAEQYLRQLDEPRVDPASVTMSSPRMPVLPAAPTTVSAEPASASPPAAASPPPSPRRRPAGPPPSLVPVVVAGAIAVAAIVALILLLV